MKVGAEPMEEAREKGGGEGRPAANLIGADNDTRAPCEDAPTWVMGSNSFVHVTGGAFWVLSDSEEEPVSEIIDESRQPGGENDCCLQT